MNNYKLFNWHAQLFCGPSFDISYIALTVDEARAGIFKQFEEISQAFRMDAGKILPIYTEPCIHTEFITDTMDVNLFSFTQDTVLENGTLLGRYIMFTSPSIRPLNLARIMVNSY
jgi:hypothetical protein